MKRSHLIAALLSTLAMGFFVGRLSSSGAANESGKDEAGEKQSKLRTRVADRPDPNASNSSASRLRQDVRKAPPGKLAAMMAPVMETVDPILRRQLLYDLFERMDAGNFREMTEAMDRAALETGRDNHIEWLLIHTRAGQVAGAEAMKQWDPENGVKITDPAWRTMWGWASNDPDAALQWLNQKEKLNPADRAKLLNAIASGAIMRDPSKAADLLSTFNEAEKLQCVGQFTFDLVQNGGKESAISWLQSVRNSEPDSAFAKRVTENVFDKVMYQSINQGSPATMIADMERLSAVMPVNEVLVQRGLSQLRERRPVAGLEFLDKFSQSSAFQDQGVGDQMLSGTLRLALTRDRNGVADWMAKNRGSSIYQRVSEAYQQSSAVPAP